MATAAAAVVAAVVTAAMVVAAAGRKLAIRAGTPPRREDNNPAWNLTAYVRATRARRRAPRPRPGRLPGGRNGKGGRGGKARVIKGETPPPLAAE